MVWLKNNFDVDRSRYTKGSDLGIKDALASSQMAKMKDMKNKSYESTRLLVKTHESEEKM